MILFQKKYKKNAIMNDYNNNKTNSTPLDAYNIFDVTEVKTTDIGLYSVEFIIFSTILYIILLIFALIGNLTICFVIIRRKAMHTVINYYLFSLALSDLLLVATIPTYCQELWSIRNYTRNFANLSVDLITEIAYEVSLLTVTALSVERYMAICHPFKKQTSSSSYLVCISLTVIWTFSITMSSCFILIEFEDDSFVIVILVNSTLFFVIPVLTILGLYIAISVTLMRRTIVNGSDPKAVKLVGKNFDTTRNLHINTYKNCTST